MRNTECWPNERVVAGFGSIVSMIRKRRQNRANADVEHVVGWSYRWLKYRWMK